VRYRCASYLLPSTAWYSGLLAAWQVAAAACDMSHLRRLAVGSLTHYRVFKYVLAAAIAGLASDGSRPPDALFILDLSDRADARWLSWCW
jgi:hypothetical protein